MARTRSKRSLKLVKQSRIEKDQISQLKKPVSKRSEQVALSKDRVGTKLCLNCSSIDFEATFKMDPRDISTEGVPVFDLGHIKLTGSNSDCEFCVMVAQILSENRMTLSTTSDESSFPCHLRAFSCLSVLGLARTQRRLKQSPSIVIAAVPFKAEIKISIQMRDAALATGVILPTTSLDCDDTQGQRLSYIGRRICPDRIDFDILAGWHRDCSSIHNVCIEYEELMRADDGSDSMDVPYLLVIDVVTRVMVRLPSGKSYVAMSYVWGPQTAGTSLTTVHEGDKLQYPQPRTVEDALTVVQRIGERFLWLDRYSIDQTDIAAKQIAILNMADVFQNATLTIVSLAPNIDTGLWGVSSASRRPQPGALCGKLQLVSSGVVLEDTVQKSVWSTRCWTLQEALLTRKMLIFSEDQVYWKCATITQLESVKQPYTAAMLSRKAIRHPNLELFSEANIHRKRFGELPLPVYTRQVAEYTKRELSYSSDALNAFRAILSRSGEMTFYGIPVYMTQDSASDEGHHTDTGFLLGLLWSRSAHQWYEPWHEFSSKKTFRADSRPGFPSWSWTSTPHCVQFDPISFDRKLSDDYGGLFAAVYRHSPLVIAYAQIELPGHGSPARAIEKYYADKDSPYGLKEAAEYSLPSELCITSLIVRWRVDGSDNTLSSSATHVSVHLPNSIILTADQDWFKQGVVFLDNNNDILLAQHHNFEGTAILLMQYRRHGFNWRHVVWWIAIAEVPSGWRRIGLIRSVNEVKEPHFPARHAESALEREHRRPFLPVDHASGSTASYPPQREVLEELYQSIRLV